MAKQDGELSSWLIAGGLFTLTLVGIDIWYSSYATMALPLKWALISVQAGIAVSWVFEMLNFNDPNYEFIRKTICILSVLVALVVGINHAVAREDKQVIIDSKENAKKDSIEMQRIKDSISEKIGAYLHEHFNEIYDSLTMHLMTPAEHDKVIYLSDVPDIGYYNELDSNRKRLYDSLFDSIANKR